MTDSDATREALGAVLKDRALNELTATIREQAQEIEALREALLTADSVTSYIYHREGARLEDETREQLSEACRAIQKITRARALADEEAGDA